MKLSTFVTVTFIASALTATGVLVALVSMLEGWLPSMRVTHFMLGMQVSMGLAATSLVGLLFEGVRRVLVHR